MLSKSIYPNFILILLLANACSSPKTIKTTAQAKSSSSTSQPIIPKGQLNPVDYLDTFKNSSLAHVKYVTIGKVMEDLEIKSQDGGKTLNLKPNQQFTPPMDKITEGWVNPRKDFVRKFANSQGIRVELTYRGKEKYYGILEFNKVYEACAGHPSARSYFISLSEADFQAAKGGNTAVHYEFYDCAPRKGDKTVRDYTLSTQTYTSWVLWLSDIKFE